MIDSSIIQERRSGMKVFITGGTGFIGRRLVQHLLEEGRIPLVLTRSPERARPRMPAGVELVGGDPTVPGDWMARVKEADAAVNLAGEIIFGRWTKEKKERILRSRVEGTRNLVEALSPGTPKGLTLVSGSAVGYYGFHGDELLTEKDPPGEDFLSGVAVAWEEEAKKAEARGARVVFLRTGIVLGEGGGALDQMARPFRMFAGGPVGSGRQYLSWIHLEDEVGLIRFALDNPGIEGPLNATAPEPATNAEFARALGRVLHRPAVMPAPAFAVRAVLGEFAEAILNGQRVIPEKALSAGYRFRYPGLEEALRSALGRTV
jgi:uncharacterized protein (TIGR01777 family)